MDAEESSMEKGNIMMTERSVDAFRRLKGECEENKADGEKSQKKKKGGAYPKVMGER